MSRKVLPLLVLAAFSTGFNLAAKRGKRDLLPGQQMLLQVGFTLQNRDVVAAPDRQQASPRPQVEPDNVEGFYPGTDELMTDVIAGALELAECSNGRELANVKVLDLKDKQGTTGKLLFLLERCTSLKYLDIEGWYTTNIDGFLVISSPSLQICVLDRNKTICLDWNKCPCIQRLYRAWNGDWEEEEKPLSTDVFLLSGGKGDRQG